jgi:hypothetical protein
MEILSQPNLSEHRKGELLFSLIEKKSFVSSELNGSSNSKSNGGGGGGNGSGQSSSSMGGRHCP